MICLLCVSGTAARADERPSYGDTIIVGSIGDASNLIPMLSSDSASHDIGGLIYNGLVKYDKDLNLVGDLAKRWEVSRDGMTITFHLRQGVRWHDGRPFTAEDCLFGFRTITDDKTPTAYRGDYLEVKRAEAVDRYTFRVTYRRPFAPALASWGSLVVLPKHLLAGRDITKSLLTRQPIGTGPYRFKEWVTGEKIVLASNPDYFEGRPYIDGYISRIIPDPATMFLELKAGGIDWMGLTPMQYRRQTNDPAFAQQFQKYRYLSFTYTYMGYNLLSPLFQDKRVRQAISYAIDKEEIIKVVFLGLGEICTGPYKPGTWYYNPRTKRYAYDPEQAKKLLREAGWQDTDGDGVLDKEGKPFAFTILLNWGNQERLKSAEIIQRQLGQIGIKVKLRVMEWASFINEYIDKKRFEAVILGWSTGPEPDQYDIWHSSKTAPKELNFISYKNKEVDQVLEKARRTFNQEERKRYYFRFQEILAEEQPYTFLVVPYSLPVIHARFRGIQPAPAGITYNFIRWYVPAREQRVLR
ncbi:MAG: peptide-binding protein [Deltaproteobacteria bacterium RBG_16_54_18]|nr:MAG: peptide-binding protein [Deltaproteobacteria bacterium RBG_16_54_18]